MTSAASSTAAATAATRAERERLERTSLGLSLGIGAVVAGVQAAIAMPFLGRYGWDRDELYFLSAAKHPALGYVDFPPLTAWIGWAVHSIFGDSLDALRITSLAAMMLTTLLVALMARELGAGLLIQASAAGLWALSPYGLAGGSLFHPTWFDCFCWTALLYILLLALERQRPRLWLAAGAIAGIGLETKYTIAFLLAALLLALLLTDRRTLATRWPWLGAAVAVALFVPNLVWQAQHGWASLHFFASQNAKTAADTPPATYLAQQFFLGAGLVVAIVGVVWLWRRRPLRPLALLPPLITVFFLLERGRAYYPLPADSIALAAGTVALAGWLSTGGRRRLLLLAPLALLEIAVLVYALPIVVPVRSTASMISSGTWNSSFYKDEIGWPELAAQTERAWRSLPHADRADGVILAGNYGEASALAYYGRGLPLVLSGHLSWQYWRPKRLSQRFALLVGFDQQALTNLCRTDRRLAVIDNAWHLDNEERGRTITFCRLRAPLGAVWNQWIATNSL